VTRPRFYTTEAIVLRHTPWGEADLLLTLYTPRWGKVRAVARGARRPRSRLVGHLEPLTRVSLALTTGRGLDVVTGAQVLDGHRPLREDLEMTSLALYCAELVDAFTAEEQPSTPLYHLLRRTLERLPSWPDPTTLVRYFEFRLLSLCGYLPELYRCVACNGAVAPGGHAFSPARGGVLCPSCYNDQGGLMPLSVEALKVLRFFHREEAEAVSRLRLPPRVAREVEGVLGGFIAFILEREVNTARFLHRLRRLREGLPRATAPAT